LASLIAGTHGADTRDDRPADSAAKEWSDAELIELGNMLVRGLSIEEIARFLRRDHGDVQDKMVEVGRACRGGSSIPTISEPATLFRDRVHPEDWRVEKIDDDGGIEVAIFSGPDTRDRAIEYADWRYRGDFEEVNLSPLRAP
jgi:hypothetical protein